MITGHVDTTLEPTVELPLRGPLGRTRRIPFVIDTGFNAQVSLPTSLIDDLQLEWKGSDRAVLADGTIIEFDSFDLMIDWDGIWITVEAGEADSVPLLGTALLHGYELKAEMRSHGKLTLKNLPPKKRKTRT